MDIKIGMNLLLWAVEITPQNIPVFEGIKAAGFDGVEIPMVGQSTADIHTMATACDELGLERTCVAFIEPEVNPISADPAIRHAAVENLKRRIDDTATVGSKLLAGGIYQAHKVFVDRGPNADEWQWCTEVLRAAGEHAQQAGISLGLEFLNRFEAYLLNTSADTRRMVEAIGLDNVGVHYDTHHANIEEPDPATAIPALHDCLNHVHLSESHRGTLGTGQVDWDASFEALEAIDYSGWLTIEAFGNFDDTIVKAANIWRNAFDSPEQLYTDGIAFIRRRLEQGSLR